jgi:hypothetical protein
MSKYSTLAAASLLLATACANEDQDHGHGHGGDATAHEPHVAEPAPPSPAPAVDDLTLGAWSVAVQHGGGQLLVTATDASGAAVTAEGELRVVLTATGGEEQRLVLQPGTDGWSAAADLGSAKDFVAVLSAEVDGRVETARVTSTAGSAAPEPDQDDDHGHGAHGHDH